MTNNVAEGLLGPFLQVSALLRCRSAWAGLADPRRSRPTPAIPRGVLERTWTWYKSVNQLYKLIRTASI